MPRRCSASRTCASASDAHEAVKGITFDVSASETVALVGESGSGKSVTALSIMRLLPDSASLGGRIRLSGNDMLALAEPELRALRGGQAGMIFQEPMTSLNPVLTVGFQVSEALRYHGGHSTSAADAEALRLFDRVRIPDAGRRFGQYPHTFSGGMRQRIMIAMALACRPKLLIADEPTTALDVTVQAEILSLLRRPSGRDRDRDPVHHPRHGRRRRDRRPGGGHARRRRRRGRRRRRHLRRAPARLYANPSGGRAPPRRHARNRRTAPVRPGDAAGLFTRGPDRAGRRPPRCPSSDW